MRAAVITALAATLLLQSAGALPTPMKGDATGLETPGVPQTNGLAANPGGPLSGGHATHDKSRSKDKTQETADAAGESSNRKEEMTTSDSAPKQPKHPNHMGGEKMGEGAETGEGVKHEGHKQHGQGGEHETAGGLDEQREAAPHSKHSKNSKTGVQHGNGEETEEGKTTAGGLSGHQSPHSSKMHVPVSDSSASTETTKNDDPMKHGESDSKIEGSAETGKLTAPGEKGAKPTIPGEKEAKPSTPGEEEAKPTTPGGKEPKPATPGNKDAKPAKAGDKSGDKSGKDDKSPNLQTRSPFIHGRIGTVMPMPPTDTSAADS
ncbi:hypothetical protein ANO11243_045720 [Dothideomycetidae sp. 11243]|nr:hypothetical protein ANO11243_045720 [fungal sp. No.11243]